MKDDSTENIATLIYLPGHFMEACNDPSPITRTSNLELPSRLGPPKSPRRIVIRALIGCCSAGACCNTHWSERL